MNHEELDLEYLNNLCMLKIARQKVEINQNKAILIQQNSKIENQISSIEYLNSEIIKMEAELAELDRKNNTKYQNRDIDNTLAKSKYDFIFEYPLDENGRRILPKEFITPALKNYCSRKGIKYTTTNRTVYEFIFEYQQDENGRYILPKEVVTSALKNYCSRKGIRYTTKNN